jgi:hypothetical protein
MQNYKKKININTLGAKKISSIAEILLQKTKISSTKMFTRKLFCIFALLNFASKIKLNH